MLKAVFWPSLENAVVYLGFPTSVNLLLSFPSDLLGALCFNIGFSSVMSFTAC